MSACLSSNGSCPRSTSDSFGSRVGYGLKFDELAAGHAGERLRREIKDAVRSLENIQISDLMRLLNEVSEQQDCR
jgi:hypothetical protein